MSHDKEGGMGRVNVTFNFIIIQNKICKIYLHFGNVLIKWFLDI